MDGGDVGVIELGERLGFLAEPLPGFLVPDPPLGQYLQSDVAVQPLVVGTVNHAHAAGPYLFENAIAAERPTQHGFGLPLPEAYTRRAFVLPERPAVTSRRLVEAGSRFRVTPGPPASDCAPFDLVAGPLR